MAFSWSPETGRYRGADGRFVPDAKVREALDQVIQAQATRMRDNTQSLIDGNLGLADWQVALMAAIKTVHLDGLALARGGWAQLDQADLEWVGQRIKQQYVYAIQFSVQIGDGRQTLGAGALARVQMYAAAARSTHREAQRQLASGRGMDEERNRLHEDDNCKGCIAETRRGWVPIGSLVPCGDRDCLTNCKCTMTYRKKP